MYFVNFQNGIGKEIFITCIKLTVLETGNLTVDLASLTLCRGLHGARGSVFECLREITYASLFLMFGMNLKYFEKCLCNKLIAPRY
jgi:hypothetical protein